MNKELTLALAALDLLEVALPRIQELARTGEITAAEQQQVRERYQALRAAGDTAFTGPQWQPSGQPN